MPVEPIERVWERPVEIYQNGEYFNVGNGSIQQNGDGYVLINRLQNFPTSLGRPPDVLDSFYRKDQTISYNLWIDLDKQCDPVRSHIIDQALVYKKSVRQVNKQMIIGTEDTRLMPQHEGVWFFVTSTGHFERWNRKEFWGQGIGYLSEDTKSIEHIQRLEFGPRRTMEKNWLPFIYNDEIHILYQSDPLVIIKPDIYGVCHIIHHGVRIGLPTFRGSGAPIIYGDRFLYSIHEQGKLTDMKCDPPRDHYFYLHRFVEMNGNFEITRISPLFCFREHGVEYSCGMCYNHAGTEILIPYSSANGTDSNLIGVAVETVEEMLNA